MRSDIYILRPCHGSANSSRSNDPYGKSMTTKRSLRRQRQQLHVHQQRTRNSDNWSEALEALGPRESKKGDVARAVFYYYTMCPDEGTNISACGDLQPLRLARNDPPDAAEISRNTKINAARQQEPVCRES